MQSRTKFLGIFLFLLFPIFVLAQSPADTNAVDIVVEATSYTPNFYLGRAEPTTGNTLRLVALPLNTKPDLFTYRWKVGGSTLSQSGAVANIITPIGDDVLVSLSVIDSSGRLWAQKDEVIAISKPEIIFYEENILRGNKSLAIDENYSMIGETAVIYAEPFFFGPRTASGLQAVWKINNQTITYTDSWQRLNIKRPEDTSDYYRINLEVINKNNLSEAAEKTFNLNFGL